MPARIIREPLRPATKWEVASLANSTFLELTFMLIVGRDLFGPIFSPRATVGSSDRRFRGRDSLSGLRTLAIRFIASRRLRLFVHSS